MRPAPTFLSRALEPREGFRARAAEGPTLAEAVKDLLLLRTPPALLAMVLGGLGFARLYGRICRMEGPMFDYLWANLPASANPEDLRAAFQSLPALPGLRQQLPWLLLLAPLGILSLWLHDAVWDHTCLWLLRGLRDPRSFRVTLLAEAEVLKVGVLGAALGLLGDLPGAGTWVTVLLLPVAIYFWVLRGYALAAWHRCPVWKGVLATLLHALLVGLFALGTLALFLFLVLAILRP